MPLDAPKYLSRPPREHTDFDKIWNIIWNIESETLKNKKFTDKQKKKDLINKLELLSEKVDADYYKKLWGSKKLDALTRN